MKLYMEPANLNYFEALASETRLEILRLLSERDHNIKELAAELDISSSIVTKHVRKLESAGLIAARNASRDGNRSKICTLLHTVTEIESPSPGRTPGNVLKYVDVEMPVGGFSDIRAAVPCGIADGKRSIGKMDSPAHLLLPERFSAQILWIGSGFVEYTFPNLVQNGGVLTALELSVELGAAILSGGEPVHVSVSLNGSPLISLAVSTSMAQTGGQTPAWWPGGRCGVLMQLRIDASGLLLNGERKSPLVIEELNRSDRWNLRLDVGPSSGGFALFGKQFGSYAQDLVLRSHYL